MSSPETTSRQVRWGTEIAHTDVLGQDCLSFVVRPSHLRDLFLDARRFPDREYLVQGARRLTFSEHDAAVRATEALLRSRGMRPGSRVLLYGANSIEWVVSFWAILRSGGVVVLGNAWWGQGEIDHALATTRPTFVLADSARERKLPSDQARVDFGAIAEACTRKVEFPVDDPAPVVEDSPAIVLFTSGTTGLPKGAVLSHRGILATLQSLLVVTRRLPREGCELPAPSRALVSLPLFHVGGLQQIITPMVTGGTLIFSEGRFDAQNIAKLIEAEDIAVWSAVPTMIGRVVDFLEDNGRPPLISIRTVGLGGSPVTNELRSRVCQWFPNSRRGLAVTYGLSEAGGVVTTGAGDSVRQRPGTVGRPLPATVIQIKGPDQDGVGEILVRSPSVMIDYLPEQGEREAHPSDRGPVDENRWLHTGDVGRIDEDGYLYVTDRLKDVVIRGGENIATPHVESRLLEHPAVQEAVVVGLPHPELGEELGAIVRSRPGVTVTGDELRAFAAEGLAHFEVPSRWLFQAEPFPQNSTGKVLKRAMRQRWIDEQFAPVDDLAI